MINLPDWFRRKPPAESQTSTPSPDASSTPPPTIAQDSPDKAVATTEMKAGESSGEDGGIFGDIAKEGEKVEQERSIAAKGIHIDVSRPFCGPFSS